MWVTRRLARLNKLPRANEVGGAAATSPTKLATLQVRSGSRPSRALPMLLEPPKTRLIKPLTWLGRNGCLGGLLFPNHKWAHEAGVILALASDSCSSQCIIYSLPFYQFLL